VYYANGTYFDQYVSKDVTELPEQVRKALGNVPLITQEKWCSLKEQVMEHGLFNAYRLAIAPTGSISYIRSSTASITPSTEKLEFRDYAGAAPSIRCRS